MLDFLAESASISETERIIGTRDLYIALLEDAVTIATSFFPGLSLVVVAPNNRVLVRDGESLMAFASALEVMLLPSRT